MIREDSNKSHHHLFKFKLKENLAYCRFPDNKTNVVTEVNANLRW